MSQEATSYVTRHVPPIGGTRRAVLYMLADMANHAGRSRVTLATIARHVGLCRRQVERHVRGLREGRLLERRGRSWHILGVADHDLATCEHPWCRKQHAKLCAPKTTRPTWTRPPRTPMDTPRPHGDQGDPGTPSSLGHETGPRRPSWRRKYKRNARPP